MNIDNGLFHLSEVDPKMAKLINKYERPNFIKETNHFEAIIRSIIYQQLNINYHQENRIIYEGSNL